MEAPKRLHKGVFRRRESLEATPPPPPPCQPKFRQVSDGSSTAQESDSSSSRRSSLCSAPLLLPAHHTLPPSLEGRLQTYFTTTADGVQLRVLLAEPPAATTTAPSIVFCPGRTEFVEKYLETVADWVQKGHAVLVLDPRGQGLSDRLTTKRNRSFVHTFDQHVSDLVHVVQEFQSRLPQPHIAMGHSMGGTVVLQCVAKQLWTPAAVVCTSPMLSLLDLQSPWLRGLLCTGASIGLAKKKLPNSKRRLSTEFDGNRITQDPVRHARWTELQQNEALFSRYLTFGWIRAALRGIRTCRKGVQQQQLRVPTLLIAAGDDRIVDTRQTVELCRKATMVECKVVPGAQHELLLEQDVYRNQTLQYIDDFVASIRV